METCIFDSCALGDSEIFICPMLEQYVNQCNESPDQMNRIESWRDANLCPLTCGANKEYHSCTALSCHGSVGECEVDQNECQAEKQWNCIEGCFCKPGFVLDGTECVAITPTSCPPPGQEIEIEIQNTSELVDLSLSPQGLDHLDVVDFLSHGCFCSRLDNSIISKGKAVSELDQVCRQLMHCDKCKVEEICAGESGYPFIVKSGSNGFVCDDSKNSECQQAQCECSVTAADNIIEYVKDTGIQSIDAESCVAKQGGGNNFECCGQDNHWMLYNAGTNLECALENDLPVIKEIGSDEIRKQFPGKN